MILSQELRQVVQYSISLLLQIQTSNIVLRTTEKPKIEHITVQKSFLPQIKRKNTRHAKIDKRAISWQSRKILILRQS